MTEPNLFELFGIQDFKLLTDSDSSDRCYSTI